MPKVIDLPTVTTMDDGDYLIIEESTSGTKKITRQNAVSNGLSFYTINIGSLSDLNTVATNGSSALYFTADVAVGGVTIPTYSRGMCINRNASADAVIMVTDPSRNFYTGFRNGSTWNVRTDKPATASNVVTRNSGATISSSSVRVVDKVCVMALTLTTTASHAIGTDCFDGTISSTYLPGTGVIGVGYLGNAALIGNFRANGNLTVRVIGAALGSGSSFAITATYLLP